jgi:hypothetical protein
VDPLLPLRGERQQRPEAAVGPGPLLVPVVLELDLDHPVDVLARPAGPRQAFVDGGKELVLTELAALAESADT